MKRWYYHNKFSGDSTMVHARTRSEARAKVKRQFGVDRVPKGVHLECMGA